MLVCFLLFLSQAAEAVPWQHEKHTVTIYIVVLDGPAYIWPSRLLAATTKRSSTVLVISGLQVPRLTSLKKHERLLYLRLNEQTRQVTNLVWGA
jgi:hypothetical protein